MNRLSLRAPEWYWEFRYLKVVVTIVVAYDCICIAPMCKWTNGVHSFITSDMDDKQSHDIQRSRRRSQAHVHCCTVIIESHDLGISRETKGVGLRVCGSFMTVSVFSWRTFSGDCTQVSWYFDEPTLYILYSQSQELYCLLLLFLTSRTGDYCILHWRLTDMKSHLYLFSLSVNGHQK